jgi:hypothetical protein
MPEILKNISRASSSWPAEKTHASGVPKSGPAQGNLFSISGGHLIGRTFPGRFDNRPGNAY